MEVGGQDFYLDLLFYHLTLRCYVVLDLKTTEFRPDDAGKMNFYLSAADDLLRHPDDQPSSQAGRCARAYRGLRSRADAPQTFRCEHVKSAGPNGNRRGGPAAPQVPTRGR